MSGPARRDVDLLLHKLKDLDLDPKLAGVQIIISGHTHQPGSYCQGGILYVNPDSAGPAALLPPDNRSPPEPSPTLSVSPNSSTSLAKT